MKKTIIILTSVAALAGVLNAQTITRELTSQAEMESLNVGVPRYEYFNAGSTQDLADGQVYTGGSLTQVVTSGTTGYQPRVNGGSAIGGAPVSSPKYLSFSDTNIELASSSSILITPPTGFNYNTFTALWMDVGDSWDGTQDVPTSFKAYVNGSLVYDEDIQRFVNEVGPWSGNDNINQGYEVYWGVQVDEVINDIRIEVSTNGNENWGLDSITFAQLSPVPEPSSTALLGLGALGLLARRKR